MIALYDDEQSTTRKFTSLVICYGYAPATTGNVMVPTGCTFIPPNPTKGEFIGRSLSRPSLICWRAG